MPLPLKVCLCDPRAQLPTKATDGAAGYDLYASNEAPLTLGPGEYRGIPTGISIELPSAQMVALVFSRSGQGFKHAVSLVNSVGVIDSDYRGELIVGVINHGQAPFTVCCGDRIAQLLIVPLADIYLEQAQSLGETARGAGGFGSTGK
ncbi:MAG: dUTP diphosphatase [Oscillospiraceae bacterium]|nr:dUTP diphosphatase [Oscillospiraceae bacterium]